MVGKVVQKNWDMESNLLDALNFFIFLKEILKNEFPDGRCRFSIYSLSFNQLLLGEFDEIYL